MENYAVHQVIANMYVYGVPQEILYYLTYFSLFQITYLECSMADTIFWWNEQNIPFLYCFYCLSPYILALGEFFIHLQGKAKTSVMPRAKLVMLIITER